MPQGHAWALVQPSRGAVQGSGLGTCVPPWEHLGASGLFVHGMLPHVAILFILFPLPGALAQPHAAQGPVAWGPCQSSSGSRAQPGHS